MAAVDIGEVSMSEQLMSSSAGGQSLHSTARDALPYLNPGRTAAKVLRHRRPQTGSV